MTEATERTWAEFFKFLNFFASATETAPASDLPATLEDINRLLKESRTAISGYLENTSEFQRLNVPAGVLSKMFDKKITTLMLGTALQMAQDSKKYQTLKNILFPTDELPKIPVGQQDNFINALGDPSTFSDAEKFEAFIEMMDPGKKKLTANLSNPGDVQRLREEAKKPPKGFEGLMAKVEDMKSKFFDGLMAALDDPNSSGAQALYSMPFIGPLMQSLMPMLSGLMKQLEGSLDNTDTSSPQSGTEESDRDLQVAVRTFGSGLSALAGVLNYEFATAASPPSNPNSVPAPAPAPAAVA